MSKDLILIVATFIIMAQACAWIYCFRKWMQWRNAYCELNEHISKELEGLRKWYSDKVQELKTLVSKVGEKTT